MAKIVAARIYLDRSTEYLPPCDSIHPPVEGELRVTSENDEMHHLETFNGREWIDLGEVACKLLKDRGLDPLMSF
ncbi:MAG TPA: hypothetical protein VKY85_11585 [Candidatus Angelobacter sp.]|nr:hypothetical protein [Candidatus Angelobacter sp.]